MPFLGVLPERAALFLPAPERDVAVNDGHAWRLHPHHRHIYNKLDLALAQGLLAAPCGVAPAQYGLAAETPVFVKPIINLAGMSLGARIERAADVPAEAGRFWCELLEGEQTSTDCLMQDGRVMWFAHTRAATQRHRQRPVYWEIGVDLPALEPLIRAFLERHLAGYTGLCNVEMINGKVIEAHLRGSNGFFEFYGPAFMSSWVGLMDQGHWSAPGRISSGVVYSVFGARPPRDWPEMKRYVAEAFPQMTIQPDPQVPDRVAIIRGPSLDSARLIEAWLSQG